jgi:hypothetical protein
VKKTLQQKPKEKRYEGYRLWVDNLLLYNSMLYVPNSTDMRQSIMDEFHRMTYVGHSGYQKIVTTTK